MPNKLFFELDNEKKEKILNAALFEFSEYGFVEASTNRIVKISGISKGSLFKYFDNKEELYFYVLEIAVSELMEDLGKHVSELPTELFERVIKYSEFELLWYIEHPMQYKLIVSAFLRNNTELYQKVESKYQLKGKDIYYSLMENIDFNQINFDKQKVINIIKWVINGINEEFIVKIQENGNCMTNSLRDEYIEYLTSCMEVLYKGFTNNNGGIRCF